MSLRRIAAPLVTLLGLTVFVLALLGVASPAGALDNPDYTAPPPTTPVTSPKPPPPVETAVNAAPVRTRLAITGSDATGLAIVGGSCVAIGAGLLVVRRRSINAAS